MYAPSPSPPGLALSVRRAVRTVAYAGLGSRPACAMARLLGVKRAAVFMFHRFSDGGDGRGTDVTMLRRMLGTLRRQGIRFMRLRELYEHMAERRALPGPTAVFTVDDGYADFGRLAAPIFEGFDAQPTVFVVTDFASGRLWCWWDRVLASFAQTRRPEVVLHCGGWQYRYRIGTPPERRAQAESFIEALKWVPDAERLAILARLDEWMEVDLGDVPTEAYAGLCWNDIRRLERNGIDFAPHSVTHPMLSRVSDAQVQTEIAGSWATLQRELVDPAPIFSYPNGSPDSFGQREIDVVRASGLSGAVAFRRRYVDPQSCSDTDRFSLSRFPVPDDVSAAAYLASGWGREDA